MLLRRSELLLSNIILIEDFKENKLNSKLWSISSSTVVTTFSNQEMTIYQNSTTYNNNAKLYTNRNITKKDKYIRVDVLINNWYGGQWKEHKLCVGKNSENVSSYVIALAMIYRSDYTSNNGIRCDYNSEATLAGCYSPSGVRTYPQTLSIECDIRHNLLKWYHNYNLLNSISYTTWSNWFGTPIFSLVPWYNNDGGGTSYLVVKQITLTIK